MSRISPSGGGSPPLSDVLRSDLPNASFSIINSSITLQSDVFGAMYVESPLSINGTSIMGDSNTQSLRAVAFESGTTLDGGARFDGVDITDADVPPMRSTVQSADVTVPTGERWVGGAIYTSLRVNSTSINSSDDNVQNTLRMTGGDTISGSSNNYYIGVLKL